MSERVFADSFFYLALLNPRDLFHDRVCAWSQAYRGRAITTEAVLLELGDAYCQPEHRRVLIRLIDELRSESLVEIVSFTPNLIQRSWQLFEERSDKDWGVTDCVSFTVMRDFEVTEALTADHHFEQAGFNAVFVE